MSDQIGKAVKLGSNIANQVVKIPLQREPDEEARDLLVVLPGGQVFNHPHEIDKPSEAYMDLTDPESRFKIAGLNSPSGDISHSIPSKDTTQVFLAIKKGQKQGIWDVLAPLEHEKALNSLGINVANVNGKMIIRTGNENVTIDREQGQYWYDSAKDKFFGIFDQIPEPEVPVGGQTKADKSSLKGPEL